MNKNRKFRSSFFRAPSFLLGVGSVLNIAGSRFGFSIKDIDADVEAIRSDWATVGKMLEYQVLNDG